MKKPKKKLTPQQEKEKLRKRCVALAKKISKERDNYKCCYCGRGKPQVAIHSHHIYNEGCHRAMSADIDNLITVCFTHHNSSWINHQPSFHKNPMEMADWFRETYPERYKALKARSQKPIKADIIYWQKKYQDLLEIDHKQSTKNMNITTIEEVPKCIEWVDEEYPVRTNSRGKKVYENVHPEFFNDWSKKELKNECARLNRILEDCKKIISNCHH